MDELPADAALVALTGAVAGDAVADAVDPAELLDVDVDRFARMSTSIAAGRRSGFQRLRLAEPQAPQDAADGRRRETEPGGDRRARAALAPQSRDLVDDRLGRRPMQAVRPGSAVHRAGLAFRPEAINPLAHRSDADPESLGHGLRALPLDHAARQLGSTKRRQARILMDLHPVPREAGSLGNFSFPDQDRMDNLMQAHS